MHSAFHYLFTKKNLLPQKATEIWGVHLIVQ